MPFIPHSDDEIQEMLAAIPVKKTSDLFDEIPEHLRHEGLDNIPSGIDEMAMLKEAKHLASQNANNLCFIGAGSYQHHIPSAVWHIASRGEFLTAYTPYQAEASQGTLQLLYEYQTMIAELTGLDVANASMYDGATALAEAVLMAVRSNKASKSNRILVAGTIHPLYRETLETIVRNQHIELLTLPFDSKLGVSIMAQVETYSGQDITALVFAQPNFFGCLEEVDALTDWAFKNNVKSIAVVNPVSLALLKPPGSYGKHGVDIACGEGQPLGVPMASGGPYFGFLAAKMANVRQLPGRLIGRTVDKDGNEGFSLTLQAREQHIRRAKATSNICTNQGLLVTAATIHMALLGAIGLEKVAKACHQNTTSLVEKLTQIEGVALAFSSPFFHECLLTCTKPIDLVLEALNKVGIDGGFPVSAYYPGFENAFLVCATEMRTEEEINAYVAAMTAIMK